MDADRMNVTTLAPGAHLAAGVGLGALYFGGLWWSARLFARAGRMRTTLALMAGRFALLGGVLVLISLEGALPLLMTAFGILVARFAVMRRVRQAAP
jgi:F1F0 ATPase subunit 2